MDDIGDRKGGSARKTRFAAFLASLEKTQYETPDRASQYQHRLLERLVRHARAETDFYARRLNGLFRADDSIAWERWQDIPTLSRAEAQENEAALVARSTPEAVGKSTSAMTSGSTGRPFRHLNSPLQTLASACANERFFNWHTIDPAKLSAAIFAVGNGRARYPAGERSESWRPLYPDSPATLLSIDTPLADQVTWLRRMKPAFLSSYPSNLAALGDMIQADGGAELRLDAVFSSGEMLTDEVRSRIATTLGATPINQYGATEIGHIAASCPAEDQLHVSDELVLIEILADDGRPAEPGEMGRVVATPFYNYASPLIRYELGDYAVRGSGRCSCGRTLSTLRKILGRSRNMFRLPDGNRVWPLLLSSEIMKFVPHRQYQVVQHQTNLIEYRFVPIAVGQINDVNGLGAYVRSRLHPDIEVEASPVSSIPRSPSGKFEDYVSLVA